jgi:hypothetical protein
MILGDNDIKAIADEILRRLIPHLPTNQAYDQPSTSHSDIRREVEFGLKMIQEKRAERERIDFEIRECSQKIPENFRPDPDQYKSLSRKKYVLKLIKNPTLWAEIPTLSKQWNGRKPNKTTKNQGKQ